MINMVKKESWTTNSLSDYSTKNLETIGSIKEIKINITKKKNNDKRMKRKKNVSSSFKHTIKTTMIEWKKATFTKLMWNYLTFQMLANSIKEQESG